MELFLTLASSVDICCTDALMVVRILWVCVREFWVCAFKVSTKSLKPYIRASVDTLCRDGTDMRGDAQNTKSFQAPRM